MHTFQFVTISFTSHARNLQYQIALKVPHMIQQNHWMILKAVREQLIIFRKEIYQTILSVSNAEDHVGLQNA